MVDVASMLMTLFLLLGTACFMIVMALVFSSFSFSKFVITQKGIVAKVVIGVVLGVLAIYGSYMGTRLPNGTIANVRELAVMIAGVTGGPFAGFLAGIIGGVHRYTLGGATALPCALSTIIIGVASGLVSTKMLGKTYLLKGLLLGFCCQIFAMGMILLLVTPFETASSIVMQITLPMVTANTIGLVLWLYLFNRFNVLH